MLSALATSAVPNFQVVSAQTLPGNELDVALVHDVNRASWIVELPRSDEAESRSVKKIRAVRALGDGIRSRLTFRLPKIAGTSAVGSRTLSVFEFLGGNTPSSGTMSAEIAESIGKAIAEIHNLPQGSLEDFDLPSVSAIQSARECTEIVDRAAATGLLTKILLRRWETACEDPELWQFQPAIVNGSLKMDSFMIENQEVTAIDNWEEVHLGDPAKDLAWLTSADTDRFAGAIYSAYRVARSGLDKWAIQRARFYAELDLAKWLLHGIEEQSSAISSDAVDMLNELSDRVVEDPERALTLSVSEAKHPLER